ncbi:cysteine-rich CWC family protein [Mesonia sp. K7]|uniref:cysteine-rich CWC family protein n=1 Tax=Mesonia sp. K7 TaxID=2218606 RepID=UPI000DAA44DE|nr:hypothetical protein DNG35_06710 [Mesonia sp. K7]
MKKQCEKCKNMFECHAQTIAAYDCKHIFLSEKQTNFLKKNYRDCLCLNCLKELSVRVNFTK